MRRFLACLISFTLLFQPAFDSMAQAAAPDDADGYSAKSVLLVESASMQPLIEKNASEALPVGGLARLPALLLVCMAIDGGALSPDDVVSVNDIAASIPGTTAFIESGESIAVKELVKAAIMIGAGDAICALAYKLYGTEQAYIDAARQALTELGINSAVTGLTDTTAAYSAWDIAKIGAELMQSECFLSYSSIYMDGITHEGDRYTELVNQNRMIRSYPGCIGGMTGSSQDSGYCCFVGASFGDGRMLCVILNAQNSKERFAQAQSAFDYGISNYSPLKLANKNEIVAEHIPVKNGTMAYIDLAAATDMALLLSKSEKAPEKRDNIPECIDAPIKAGDILGSVDYLDESGNIIATLELVALTNVDKAAFTDRFVNIALAWLRA